MDTVSKLAVYARCTNSDVKIIGVPKTIDNDLVLTDHSPGFGSAAKYVATTVRDIVMDASVYDTQSVRCCPACQMFSAYSQDKCLCFRACLPVFLFCFQVFCIHNIFFHIRCHHPEYCLFHLPLFIPFFPFYTHIQAVRPLPPVHFLLQ